VVLGAPVSRSSRLLRPAVLLPGVLSFLSFAWSRPARADVSSWAAVAAGPTFIDDGKNTYSAPSLEMETGLGTAPKSFLVVGGLFHVETHFGLGTDLGLLSRFATRGFVLGDWGAAIDLGGYERFWGRKSAGGLGKIVLGAPWGLELSAGGGYGTNDAHHFGVTLGIDFLRLSIFRTVGEKWFPNPYPAYRKAAE
jgi:hypothetical protein